MSRKPNVIGPELLEKIRSKCTVNSKECWEYQGKRNKDGYGMIKIGGKEHRVHRIVYLIVHGSLELDCLHHCDNPSCCNPDHLWEGTDKDNSEDKVSKGRSNHRTLFGAENGRTKLTPEDKDLLLNMYFSDPEATSSRVITQQYLADYFGVSKSLVQKVILAFQRRWGGQRETQG